MERVALVTGSTRGLGLALSRVLATHSIHVMVTARHREDVLNAVHSLGIYPKVHGLSGDITDPLFRQRLIQEMMARFGRFDILINNVASLGTPPLAPVATLDLDDLRKTLEVNLLAALDLTQRALPYLEQSPSPLVLSLSSDAATEAYPGWLTYGASKAALELAMSTLAHEHPAIPTYIVDPGDMDTRMHHEALPDDPGPLRDPHDVALALQPLLLGHVHPKSGTRLTLFESQGALTLSGLDVRAPLNLGIDITPATSPPEHRDTPDASRDQVKLLTIDRNPGRFTSHDFSNLDQLFHPGDLLVVNNSATIGASFMARVGDRPAKIHLAARLGAHQALVELRTSQGEADWRELPVHTPIEIRDASGRTLSTGMVKERFHPKSRVWLAETHDDWYALKGGDPIRYGYVPDAFPLEDYQTLFGTTPGSVEMPSASRPFTPVILDRLLAAQVEVASITLHTTVSSHEVEDMEADFPIFPEWYQVSPLAAAQVNRARRDGRPIIALGTTVVRALETAQHDLEVEPQAGWTTHLVTPKTPPLVVNGLITGLHDNFTSHLALLEAFVSPELLTSAYRYAREAGFQWHEFGDLCLIR